MTALSTKLLTLEEAIEHCQENAVGDTPCARNHRQLAEWLLELQARRYNKAPTVAWGQGQGQVLEGTVGFLFAHFPTKLAETRLEPGV